MSARRDSTFAGTGFRRALAWLRLGRPHFLIGGLLLHGLGVAMALYAGASFDRRAYWWGQLAVTATQLMTHYANDYFDLEADRANRTPTNWSGGSRVLPEGDLSPRVALVTAQGLGLLALGAALVLVVVVKTGVLTLPLLGLALFLAWSYSAPPFKWHSRGVGELIVTLLVTGLTPLVGFYLQRGAIELLPVLAVWPLGCLQFAMILSVHMPDAAGDAVIGKRTLVVRLGGARTASLYTAVLLAAYASLLPLVWAGLPLLVAEGVALGAPLAALQAWRMQRRDWANPESWNSLAFWSIGLLILTMVAELAAFAGLVATGGPVG